jgi:hypothetical protein
MKLYNFPSSVTIMLVLPVVVIGHCDWSAAQEIPVFQGTSNPLPHSQEAITGPCPEPNEIIPHLHTVQ